MKVIIALVILYLANFATSYYLHKKYVASQKRVRQYGGVSTARVKGSLRKKGKIVLLAFNEEDDTITYGEKFEGITVFSKFEKIEGIEGLTLDEVESKFEDEPVTYPALISDSIFFWFCRSEAVGTPSAQECPLRHEQVWLKAPPTERARQA